MLALLLSCRKFSTSLARLSNLAEGRVASWLYFSSFLPTQVLDLSMLHVCLISAIGWTNQYFCRSSRYSDGA